MRDHLCDNSGNKPIIVYDTIYLVYFIIIPTQMSLKYLGDLTNLLYDIRVFHPRSQQVSSPRTVFQPSSSLADQECSHLEPEYVVLER